MENKNLSNQYNPVYTNEMKLPKIFLHEFPAIQEIIKDLNMDGIKAPFADEIYINDREYVVSVAQL